VIILGARARINSFGYFLGPKTGKGLFFFFFFFFSFSADGRATLDRGCGTFPLVVYKDNHASAQVMSKHKLGGDRVDYAPSFECLGAK